MPIKMSPENIVAFKILPIYYLNTKVEYQCFTMSELPTSVTPQSWTKLNT